MTSENKPETSAEDAAAAPASGEPAAASERLATSEPADGPEPPLDVAAATVADDGPEAAALDAPATGLAAIGLAAAATGESVATPAALPATVPTATGDGGVPRTERQPWWRPRPFSRPIWYPVVSAVAVVALLAGGAMTLLTVSGGAHARPLASDCGLVTCGARLPGAVTSTSAPGTAVRSTAPAHRRDPAVDARVLTPKVHSRPVAQAPPARAPHRWHPRPPHPGPPGPPGVTVTYTLDGTNPWQQNFNAHLTIVNHSAAPVAGWTIQVSLPGDQVDWVGSPGGWDPFANWQFNGGTLALNAVSGGETIAPGGTEIVPITAQGSDTAPSGCMFNGAACQG